MAWKLMIFAIWPFMGNADSTSKANIFKYCKHIGSLQRRLLLRLVESKIWETMAYIVFHIYIFNEPWGLFVTTGITGWHGVFVVRLVGWFFWCRLLLCTSDRPQICSGPLSLSSAEIASVHQHNLLYWLFFLHVNMWNQRFSVSFLEKFVNYLRCLFLWWLNIWI